MGDQEYHEDVQQSGQDMTLLYSSDMRFKYLLATFTSPLIGFISLFYNNFQIIHLSFANCLHTDEILEESYILPPLPEVAIRSLDTFYVQSIGPHVDFVLFHVSAFRIAFRTQPKRIIFDTRFAEDVFVWQQKIEANMFCHPQALRVDIKVRG